MRRSEELKIASVVSIEDEIIELEGLTNDVNSVKDQIDAILQEVAKPGNHFLYRYLLDNGLMRLKSVGRPL